MWWLWIAGPLSLVVIYLLTGWPDRRRLAEIERWRASMGPKTVVRKEKAGYRSTKEIIDRRPGTGAKRLGTLPGPLKRMVDAAGAGDLIGHYELVPRLAYLSITSANSTSGSDLQTVTAKLEEAGPTFIARPLPIVEGERIPNTGVQFKKDPDFMAYFLVEAPGIEMPPPPPPKAGAPAAAPPEPPVAKKVRAWLSRPIREALLDFPDVWLSVQGSTMALTLYGAVSADKIHALVAAADVIFAEHGADGGPSLLGDSLEEEDAVDDESDEVAEAAPKKREPVVKAKASAPEAGSKPAEAKAPAKATPAKTAAKATPAKATPAKVAPVKAASPATASTKDDAPVRGTPNKRI